MRSDRSNACRAIQSVAISVVLMLSAAVLSGCGGKETPDLYAYVGGTMRPAMEELAKMYEKDTGLRIYLDCAGSGENMIKAKTTGKGDIYVAHDPFHNAMIIKDLADEGWHVGAIKPMIAVAKGNPKNIEGLKDLTQEGISLVLTDPEYSTTGHIVDVMVKKAGLTEAIKKNIKTRKRGGSEAANDVMLGHADAAIVWDAVLHVRKDKLDVVDVAAEYRPQPEVDAVTSPTFGDIDMSCIRVTVDLLKSSEHPKRARKFAEFIASEKARKVWKDFGFSVPEKAKHLTDD